MVSIGRAEDGPTCTQHGNMLKVRRAQRSWSLPSPCESACQGKPIDAFLFSQEMQALRRDLADIFNQIQFTIHSELQNVKVKTDRHSDEERIRSEERIKSFESLERIRKATIENLPIVAPNLVSHTAANFERCEEKSDEDSGPEEDPAGWINGSVPMGRRASEKSSSLDRVSPRDNPAPTRNVKNRRRLKKSPTSPVWRGDRVASEACIDQMRLPKTLSRIDLYGSNDSEKTTQSCDPLAFRRGSEGSLASLQSLRSYHSLQSMESRKIRPCRSQEAMDLVGDGSQSPTARRSLRSDCEESHGSNDGVTQKDVLPSLPPLPQSHLPYVTTNGRANMSPMLARRRSSISSVQLQLLTQSWHGRVRKLVQSDVFDTVSAVLVVLNAATIGMQTDYMARHLLERAPLGYRLIDTVFCALFTTELVLRFLAFGSKFFCGADWMWNVFDFMLVGLQLSDEIVSHIASTNDSRFNFSFMRVLRILRLVRVLRVIRILRLIGDLRTIVSSIAGSMKSLLWTTTLIFLFVYVLAVYFTQLVLDYRVSLTPADEKLDSDNKLQLYFGSLGRSILTLYEAISGGLDWDALADPLMGRISVICAIVLAGYTAFCLLALMNVVTGVFVQAALESAKQDRTSYMLRHVRELFKLADPENTGSLNWEQFESCLDKEFMQEFFKVIDVDRSDAKNVFALLDSDDSGEINLDEFLNGCLGLHGPAKSLHLATLMYQSRITARYQALEMEHMYKHLQCIMHAIPSLADHASLEKPEMEDSIRGRKSFHLPSGAQSPATPASCRSQSVNKRDSKMMDEMKRRRSFQKVLQSPAPSEAGFLAHPLAQSLDSFVDSAVANAQKNLDPPTSAESQIPLLERKPPSGEKLQQAAEESTGSDPGSGDSQRSPPSPSLGVPNPERQVSSSSKRNDEGTSKPTTSGSNVPIDLS